MEELRASVEPLSDLLDDAEAGVRLAAAVALGEVLQTVEAGPERDAACRALRKALKDSDRSVQRAAATALLRIAPEKQMRSPNRLP